MADELELKDQMSFQEWDWRFQRAGWVFLLVIVLMALAGILGSGPLSKSMVEKEMLRIDFDRFARRGATSFIEITYRQQGGDTSLVLEFAHACLERVELEGTRPNAKSSMAREGEGLSYEFDLAPGASWSKFQFLVKPGKAGIRDCRVTADGLATLEFKQLIYP